MSWFTLVKKAASLIPTPTTGKGRLFLDDAGAVAVKNDAGALLTLQAIPQGFIEGLRMEWVSGTQIRVSTGAAYVPGVGRVVELAAPVTLTPTLSASTWYHLYLVGGTVTAEADTTAPAAPYYGTARAKTGDTSRRYIGSFRTNGSSAISKFDHDLSVGNSITYLDNINTLPFIVVSAGSAVSPTTVSCSVVIPMTSRTAKFLANNNATGQFVYMSNSTAAAPLGSNDWLSLIMPGSSFYGSYPLDPSQAFTYMFSAAPTGGQVFIRVAGYFYER